MDIRPTRSIQQNRFYWGVLIPIVRDGLIEVGYDDATTSSTHHKLKELFLSQEQVDEDTGEITAFDGSTTQLDTKQFQTYVLCVQKFAAEFLGCIVPDPQQEIFL